MVYHIIGRGSVVFERSGHVRVLEEPARLNREQDAFAHRVFDS
jgi:hypothetical protein